VTRHNSGGSHGLAGNKSEKMNRAPIVFIQLDLFRHALFFHKDAHADRESHCQFLFRRDSPDSNDPFHSRPYALIVKALQGESLKGGAGFYFRR
jgi:hypothetical protein